MVRSIAINSSAYPKALKTILDPPKKLYYKGNFDRSIFDNCLAVVGSRKMTTYGKQITELLVSEIARSGITIVSGFMYGIDATAHQAALDGKGRTIACMPCGIDMIHPAYQEKLYNDILANDGLIVSEFEGTFPPARWTYPRRNRIVAGLSKATMVVEAASNSGSLITAKLAKEYKRKLFSVPGMLTSSVSQGTMQLIKDGVEVVVRAEDVLTFFECEQKTAEVENIVLTKLNPLQQRIFKELKHEPKGIDILSYKVNIPISKLGTELSLMQLDGVLIEESGKYYIKNKGKINVS